MPFGLMNSLAIFSRIVIPTFREFIRKFMEVYMDDWTVYSLLKENIEFVQFMFN
jgi:hypothetical protein